MAPSQVWRRSFGALLVALCVGLVFVQCEPAGSVAEAMPSSTSPAPLAATSNQSASSQNIFDFFPQINGDLTKVTWAHAVNSKALLEEALNGSALMLEADVILGSAPDLPDGPVMGHPPANSSDLSLRAFLRSVVTHNKDNPNSRKGIKLDFKSIEVFEKATTEMKESFEAVPRFPVWLNADILDGPVNATATPVDPKRFLAFAKQFPSLMLSLGWTTRWGKALDGHTVPESEAAYSQEDIGAMEDTIRSTEITQPITFAVRAAFVANSLDSLSSLLKNTTGNNSTLTVWMSDSTDKVDIPSLRKSILAIGKDKVYMDVPAEVSKELNLAGSSSAAPSASLLSALFAVIVLLCGGAGSR